MSPQKKIVFQPTIQPDGSIKAIKSYLEWLNLSVMEMEILSRFKILSRMSNGDEPAFWIFQDTVSVRAILKMEAK
jgi:hypothetical protein